jgi:hypothetical protein
MMNWRATTIATALLFSLSACSEQPSDRAATGASTADATTSTAQSAAFPASTPAPTDDRAVEASLREAFAPYFVQGGNPPSTMAPHPHYSAGLNAMMRAWQAAIAGPEPTELADADWLCSCQDWDASRARLVIDAVSRNDDGRYTVTATFQPGFEGPTEMTDFIMRQEGGRWLIDDIHFAGESPTLRELLAQETQTGGA